VDFFGWRWGKDRGMKEEMERFLILKVHGEGLIILLCTPKDLI
jgi:hypothetical protein